MKLRFYGYALILALLIGCMIFNYSPLSNIGNNVVNAVNPYENHIYLIIGNSEEDGSIIGTGFYIKYRGEFYFVTAKHVVDGMDLLTVMGRDGSIQVFDTKYFTSGEYPRDVAFIKAKKPKNYFKLYNDKDGAMFGIRAVAIGYGGGHLTVVEVDIRMMQKRGDSYRLEGMGDLFGGMSGGPIILNGVVIGVIVERHRYYPLGYFLPSSELIKAIEEKIEIESAK